MYLYALDLKGQIIRPSVCLLALSVIPSRLQSVLFKVWATMQ